ncbi:MAG: DUF4180 domain-containing protein [Chloroflexi bacterium]|nr:MAG: DUF4180 domain-containing protein [Chloroflexota bacterium]MBL1195604.1 DUF4180 domain-containing protein [Chloroflexota bacterium]NOH12891.1 DUF4180 domain-containing protein [Chloroflexota bacterium]
MPTYIELDNTHSFDPNEVIESCANAEAQAVLADDQALPSEFFDLSSGFAGELVNKLSMYRIRLAGVVPDVSIHSEHFQAFAREANRRGDIRFFLTREEAINWLEAK